MNSVDMTMFWNEMDEENSKIAHPNLLTVTFCSLKFYLNRADGLFPPNYIRCSFFVFSSLIVYTSHTEKALVYRFAFFFLLLCPLKLPFSNNFESFVSAFILTLLVINTTQQIEMWKKEENSKRLRTRWINTFC